MGSAKKENNTIMRSAFKKLFKVSDEQAKSAAAMEWMENAAISIVEYNGKLRRESQVDADRRQEMNQVYQKDIQPLVKHLRKLYPERTKDNKFELLFSVANEINDVQKMLAQNTEDTASSEAATTVSENSSTGTDKHTEETRSEIESLAEDKVVTTSVSDDSTGSASVDTSLFNKSTNNYMEEKHMADASEMLKNAANAVATSADNSAAEQNAATEVKNKSNAKVQATDEEKEMAKAILAGELDERNEYVTKNQVEAIVAVKKPNALRIKGKEGFVGTTAEMADPEKKKGLEDRIAARVKKFVYDCTGNDKIATISDFEKLSENEKYANVVADENGKNLVKAKATYELIKRLFNNPTEAFAVYVPEREKITFSAKGYIMAGKPFTNSTFKLELLDHTTGTVYAVGQVTADGKNAVEKPITFGLATAKAKSKAGDKNGGERQTTATYVTTIKTTQKSQFTKDDNHIRYLQVSELAEEKSVPFSAAITVDGKDVSASFQVYKLDANGQKIPKGGNSKGFKVKTVNFKVSAPVTAIDNKIAPEFNPENLPVETILSNWDIKVPSVSKDFGAITDANALPKAALSLFAMIANGTYKLDKAMQGSAYIKELKGQQSKMAAASVASQASDLDG